MGAASEHRETVTLTGGLRTALAAYAARTGKSKSRILAMALMAFLGVDEDGKRVRRVV